MTWCHWWSRMSLSKVYARYDQTVDPCVQYSTLEDSARALEGCKTSVFNGRLLTVEYVSPDASRPPPKETAHRRDSHEHPPARRDSGRDYAPRSTPRDTYAPRYDRASPPPRRPTYDREEYAPQPGRLERSRGPPVYRAQAYPARHDHPPAARYIEAPRYVPEYCEPRRASPPQPRRRVEVPEVWLRPDDGYYDDALPPARHVGVAERYAPVSHPEPPPLHAYAYGRDEADAAEARPRSRYRSEAEELRFVLPPKERYASMSPGRMPASPMSDGRRACASRRRDDW